MHKESLYQPFEIVCKELLVEDLTSDAAREEETNKYALETY